MRLYGCMIPYRRGTYKRPGPNYKTNFPQYAGWHAYFRQHQPPALVLWGKHDPVFIVPGAEAYLRDLPRAVLHVLDGGHFLLEGQHRAVAVLIDQFLAQHLVG